MKPETWRRVDESLADALEQPAQSRVAFLQARLGDDAEAFAEAQRLIEQAEKAELLFSQSPVTAWAELGSGSRLGPWELVRPLGSGGMGVVWLARRAEGEVEMLAAIKLLPPALRGTLRSNADLHRRFLREKQILARLDHPNIARLLDVEAGAGESPNFVMEYVEGQRLEDYLRSQNPTPRERLNLFLKICDAVHYAHANLVIHRDLKPQNILVTSSGEPKLLDFGIARTLNDTGAETALTIHRAFSLDYASPEQIRGGNLSTATDIYSLGLLLYEILTGSRARRWGDLPLAELLTASDRFRLPAHPAVQGDLVAILAKATALEPALRYGSAAEFATDIRRYQEGRPVEARPAGWLYAARCFTRRNRLAVAASLVFLVSVLALAFWGAYEARRATQGEAQAVQTARQLQVALNSERQARAQVEQERARAEAQTRLAQRMEAAATQRGAEAEARLKSILKILDSLLKATRRDVSRLAGGTAVSVNIVEQALKQIEELQPNDAAELNLLLLRADAHNQLAELYGGANSNLGQHEQASVHRERAARIWRLIAARRPASIDWQRGLLVAEFGALVRSLGPVHSDPRWGEYEQRFLALAARKDPSSARAVGNFYFWVGSMQDLNVLERRQQFLQALSWFERSADDPESDHLRDMALCHKYLAATFSFAESDKRIHHAQEALRLDQLRAQNQPSDLGAQMDLAFSLNALGDAYSFGRRWPDSLHFYQESFQRRRSLYLADPSNRFIARSLAYPLRFSGFAAFHTQNWPALRAATEAWQWLQQKEPEFVKTNLMQAAYHLFQARLLEVDGDRPAACRAYAESAKLSAELTQSNFPKDSLAQKMEQCRD